MPVSTREPEARGPVFVLPSKIRSPAYNYDLKTIFFYMFTKNELTDLIWTKSLKITFLVERTHWESWVEFCERVWEFCRL